MWHNIRKAAFKVSKYFIIVRSWFQLSNACSLKHPFMCLLHIVWQFCTINTKRLCGFYYCQCFNILTNRIAVKNYKLTGECVKVLVCKTHLHTFRIQDK